MIPHDCFKDTGFPWTRDVAFEPAALALFRHQAANNQVYKTFLSHLGVDAKQVQCLEDIPYMPIDFFKYHQVLCSGEKTEQIFTSSGTTLQRPSKHHCANLKWYESICRRTFEDQFGPIKDYTILALLPAYLERQGSSLVHMAQDFILASNQAESGFYLDNYNALAETLSQQEALGRKTLLLGVSFALLDFAEKHPMPLKNTTIMETGGMKGRRKEIVREELHAILKEAFQLEQIHSEYGMTELMSQAYAKGSRFTPPPWMRIQIRETSDPLSYLNHGQTGGINIIDLGNYFSCAFLATQDLGKTYPQGDFEVLGRFDHSDVRGCNLLVAE